MSNNRQLTKGDPPAWGLGKGLTNHHYKNPAHMAFKHGMLGVITA